MRYPSFSHDFPRQDRRGQYHAKTGKQDGKNKISSFFLSFTFSRGRKKTMIVLVSECICLAGKKLQASAPVRAVRKIVSRFSLFFFAPDEKE